MAQEADVDLTVRLWVSVPVRLGIGVLVLMLAAATLVLLTLARQEAQQFTEQHVGHARKTASMIAADLASRMLAGGGSDVWNGVSAAVAGHADTIDASLVLVLTKDGVVKAGSDAARVGQQIRMKGNPQCPGCDGARGEDFPASAILSTPEGLHQLRVVNSIPVSQACLECHANKEEPRSYVAIDFDLTPLERANKQRQIAILGMGLVASFILLALITFLFRRLVMRPVDFLIGSMGRLAGGDLSARTPVLAKDELGLLARHFNHMAGQIEDQVVRIEAAHTESQLLYMLVVEASKNLEMSEFARGVSRVILDKLHSRHTAFFLETADSGWICATAEAQEGVWARGEETLETALVSSASQFQELLDGVPLEFIREVCRIRQLRFMREDGEKTFALPVIAEARLVGLLVCAGIAEKVRVNPDLLHNLGVHLTLAAVNSRNYTGAITDGLTRLKNKRYGLARLEEAIFTAQRNKSGLALAMCDIDHFKQVNDTYGHPAGDTVLREVSRRIAGCVRKGDIAVRYGGEEFLLILPEADANVIAMIGEKIRQAVAMAPVDLGAPAGSVPITASVGIVALRADEDSVASLVDRADRMLYRAKDRGRNRVEFDR